MKTIKLALIALLLLPVCAQAEFSYTYLEGGWMTLDPDGGSSLNGIGIGGSVAAAQHVHLTASYSHVEHSNTDVDTLSVGIGGNVPVSESVDVVGTVRYLYADADTGPFSLDEDGVGAELSLRAAASPSVELDGGVRYSDVSDSETSVFVRGIFGFTETLGLFVEGDFADDSNAYVVGLRATF